MRSDQLIRNIRRLLCSVLVVASAAGCGRPEPVVVDPLELALADLSVYERAALLVASALPAGDGTGGDQLMAELVTGAAGAVVVAGSRLRDEQALLDSLRAVAPLPILVVVALDEGMGGEAGAFDAGAEGDGRTAAAAGRAVFAAGGDVAVVALPPLNRDEPLPALTLAEGGDPARIEAYLAGLRGAGLAASVRALAAGDTLAAPLRWDRARLEAIELPTLASIVEGEIPAIELAGVSLPAITGDSLPLPLSPAAVNGLLRRDLGFAGVVMADMSAGSLTARGRGMPTAAIDALAAGVDLLLGVEAPAATVDAIVAAVASGRLPPRRLEEAVRRVMRLRAEVGLTDSLRLDRRRDARAAIATGASMGPPQLFSASTGGGTADSLALARAFDVGGPAGAPASAAAAAAGERRGGTSEAAAVGSAPAATAAATATPTDAGTTPAANAAATATPAGAGSAPAANAAATATPADAGTTTATTAASEAGPALGEMAATAPLLRVVPPDSAGMATNVRTRIDAILREALADSVFSGAAVAVGRRGGLVVLRGYGRDGREAGGGEVDARTTVFDLASLTKVVGTTTAAALLVDEGLLDLDAPLDRYLPEFDGDGKGDVLIRHLLTHTSGLPSGIWVFGSARSPEEALRQIVEQPLVREPGERMEYSDLGIILLAEAVERAAGAPIDQLLARRVFAPLGMQSTMYLPPLALRGGIVPTAEITERDFPLQGIVHDANSFRLGGIAGHAGLFSTARDLAVFAQMMLNDGRYGALSILSPETVAAFTRRQPGAEQRALGWDTPSRVSSAGAYFSSRSFGHTGYTGTSLWMDPQSGLFVVLLTNRTYVKASARDILRLRAAVHDAAARAITDQSVRRR